MSPDGPSVADSVDDPTAPRIVSVVVTGGELSGDTGTVPLERNVPVRLTVISDQAQTVLDEGYDLRALACRSSWTSSSTGPASSGSCWRRRACC